MLRILNIVAILALVGSAVYAYTIKYQTSYRAEQIAKTRIEIKSERDAIAVLRAEWAFMTRPERLQDLSDKHLSGLKPLEVTQIVSAQSLPDRAARGDSIGKKLDALGLASESASPIAAPQAPTTTPRAAATPKSAQAPKAALATKPQSSTHERQKP